MRIRVPRRVRRRLRLAERAAPGCGGLLQAFCAFVAARVRDGTAVCRIEDLARVFLIGQGDIAALRELAESLAAQAEALARATGADLWTCRDAIQDLVLEISTGERSPLGIYRGSGTLGGFLKVILVRRLRRDRRRWHLRSLAAAEPAAIASDPASDAIEKERQHAIRVLIRQALDRLDAADRELLLAHVVDGRPIVECVDPLGLGRASGGHRRMHASRVFARARDRLRAAILACARRQ
ncbi:MAG: hypothetical protein Fur0037_26970 [Planctomycetota bacterium]